MTRTSQSLRIAPQRAPLRGTLTVPGDKSISHRAVLFGALGDGPTRIRRWLPAGDTLATLEAVRTLGIQVDVTPASEQAWDLVVHGRGLQGLSPPARSLDCRHAGTGLRLLAGILAGQRFATTLDGSEQLRRRPMRRIIIPLRQMGANISANNDRAPLHLRPAALQGIDYELPVASAQVKSAVLLAGLYAAGATRVREPGPARDHTERLLAAMGAPLERDATGWIVFRQAPLSRLDPLDLTVPADISSAAFPLVAAALVPHSRVTLNSVGLNPTRTGILTLLAAMGAPCQVSGESVTGGEPTGDVALAFAELHATRAAGELVVRAIDEWPIWAVAATQAAGVSRVRDAAELRVKEVDRIARLAGELRRLGAVIDEHPDGFDVHGPVRLRGGAVSSHDDHRLGMALAIAALAADSPVTVADAGCIADSFPGFVDTMRQLGADMRWV